MKNVKKNEKKKKEVVVFEKAKTCLIQKKTTSSSVVLPNSLSPSFEKKLIENKTFDKVIGVDEAGRGCLAGPVVACACCIPVECMTEFQGVVDSKVLCESNRERVYDELMKSSKVQYVVVQGSVEEIDTSNILHVTMNSMGKAIHKLIKNLSTQYCSDTTQYHILVDGNRLPELCQSACWCQQNHVSNCQAIISGDAKIYSIAAASIIAKVTRDRLLRAYALNFPEYNFQLNKGYGTASHLAAIKTMGVCKHHRLTYKPICTWLTSNEISWPSERSLVEIDPVKRHQKMKLTKKLKKTNLI